MWTSRTNKVNPDLLQQLERGHAGVLIPLLLRLTPLQALRALAEIKLNGAAAKLKDLLANEQVRNKWKPYSTDPSQDRRDHEYATIIRGEESRV